MKLRLSLVLSVVLLSTFALAQSENGNAAGGTLTGIVTDSMCGKLGTDAGHKDCFKNCLNSGAQVVIVTEDGKIWTVENPDSLRGKETKTVTVSGKTNAEAMSVKVDKVLKK